MAAPTFEQYVEKNVPALAAALAEVAAASAWMPTPGEVVALSRDRSDEDRHSLIYHLAQLAAALEQTKTWLGHFEQEVRKLRASAPPPDRTEPDGLGS